MTVFDLAFAVGLLCFLVTVLVCAGLVYELWEDWRDDAPFRIESRTVTDWLETEQPADSATGCQTTEATAP